MALIKTIVLIDDDPEIIKSCKMNLSAHYDLVCFQDSKKAVSYIQAHDVAVVILDFNLKNKSGLLVAWDLIDDYPLMPILLISNDPKDSEVIDDLGFRHVNFLLKPFRGRDLLENLIDIQKKFRLEEVPPITVLPTSRSL